MLCSVQAEVTIWGGGNGFSNVPANWVGGQLPDGNDIDLPSGHMHALEVDTAFLTVRPGAAVTVYEAGMILFYDLDTPSHMINGEMWVGTSTDSGSLYVSGSPRLRGNGAVILRHSNSSIENDGDPSTYFEIGSSLTFGGQGVINANMLCNSTVTANVPAGTLNIASAYAAVRGGVAQDGGILRLSGARIGGFNDESTVEARSGSSVVVGPGVTVEGLRLKKAGGDVTFEGPGQLQNAALSGEFTIHQSTLTEKLDLRPVGPGPAGKVVVTGPVPEPESPGIAINSDFNNDGLYDGPVRILGGEIYLKDENSFLARLVTYAGDSYLNRVRLEDSTVRGRGHIGCYFELGTYGSMVVADNPENVAMTPEMESARTLALDRIYTGGNTIDNAGVLKAANGGILRIDGMHVTNYSDGGTEPNGTPHSQGRLEATGSSRIEMNVADLTEGSVLLPDTTASFLFAGGNLSGGDGAVGFSGPGLFEVSPTTIRGQIIVTPNTTLKINGGTIDGSVLLNGSGIYLLQELPLYEADGVGDSITINGDARGAARIEVPVFVGASGKLNALEINAIRMQLNSHVTNRGIVGSFPGHALLIDSGATVQNVDSGGMSIQGPVELLGRIQGGGVLIESYIASFGGTLENVTLVKAGAPSKIDVGVGTSLHLKGTVSNNALIRPDDGVGIFLNGPVVLANLQNATGRLELGVESFIDDTDDSAPTLTIGPRQTLLAKKFPSQPSEQVANVYVPIQNNGTVGADGMILRIHHGLSGNGKLSIINGGKIEGLSWNQELGQIWQRTVEVVGGIFAMSAPSGINVGNATISASLPDGRYEVNSPVGIVAVGGGNIVALGGGNVVANGGGNVVAVGGGNIVANGGGNVVANGGGNVVAMGGGNVVANGGGNVIANGGANVIALGGANVIALGGANVIANGGGNVIANGGANIVAMGGANVIANGGGNVVALGGNNFTGAENPSAHRLASPSPGEKAHLYVGDGGTFSGEMVQLGDESILHITEITEVIDPALAANNASDGNVGGNLEMDYGSELQIQIAGRGAGDWDSLAVTGAATLEGRLNVWFLDAFHRQISSADSFTILTAGRPITLSFSNMSDGRVLTSDGRGSFAVTLGAGGLSVVLNDYRPATVQPWPAWLAAHGLPPGSDPAGDFDRDGRSNLLEFSHGTLPEASDLPVVEELGEAEGFWTFTYRRYPAERSVVASIIETSSDLLTWNPQPVAPATVLVRNLDDKVEEVTIRVLMSDAGPRFFVRSKCTLVP